MIDNKRILSEEEIMEKLKGFPGWILKGNKIVKEFELNNFMEVLKLVNSLAPFFEKNDHHPDMNISYKNITFELTRYDMDEKITELDFITAREIEEKLKELVKSRD